MPNWVECNIENGGTVFVNLCLVVAMSRNGRHTMLTYSGEDGSTLVVSDTPEEILDKPRLGATS